VATALLAFRRWLGRLPERDGRGQHQADRRGTEPTGQALATVRDPTVYDFDPTRQLHLSQVAQGRRRPQATLPLPWSTSIHPDQAALLEQTGLL